MTDRFALYMQKLGKSQNTMATYIRNIRQYFEWCEFSFGNAPPQLYRANVLEYISYMRNLKGYSPKSVNNHLSALRCLNEFLIAEGTQTETVILKTDFMKVQLQYASPCTVEKRDVDAFRQRLLESGSKRDYAIVGKGDKQRLVYINDKIVHAIREYLKERRSESPYLFVSRQSGKLSPSRINQIFNQYSDCITPKTLRHYFRGQRAMRTCLHVHLATAARDGFFESVCSHALESGYSIHEIANQAGHSNVQTTLIYSNPTAKEMKEKANRL